MADGIYQLKDSRLNITEYWCDPEELLFKCVFSDGATMEGSEKSATIQDKNGNEIESIYKSAFYKTEHGRLLEVCQRLGMLENPDGTPIAYSLEGEDEEG